MRNTTKKSRCKSNIHHRIAKATVIIDFPCQLSLLEIRSWLKRGYFTSERCLWYPVSFGGLRWFLGVTKAKLQPHVVATLTASCGCCGLHDWSSAKQPRRAEAVYHTSHNLDTLVIARDGQRKSRSFFFHYVPLDCDQRV